MEDWIIYSLITAVLIAIEYVTVKKANLSVPDLDITAFSWQARFFSLIALTLILCWTLYKEDKNCNEIFQKGSWGYAATLGVLTSLSIIAFYKALMSASNPGYPAAVKELALVLTLLFAAWVLDQPLLNLDKRVWCGVGLILGGAYLVAKYGNNKTK